MNKKIKSVLDVLQSQSDFEEKHKDELDPDKRMLAITKDTAMFYNIILKAIKAKKILEIGHSSGYSTLWFAEAILFNSPERSTNAIVTIDNDPRKTKTAKKNFADADVSDIIDIREGNAIRILSDINKTRNDDPKNTKQPFDFVFIDADKENSVNYFDLCLPMLRVGGIIAADNILDMAEMKDYAVYVKNNPNVTSVTVPIGWGQELAVKL